MKVLQFWKSLLHRCDQFVNYGRQDDNLNDLYSIAALQCCEKCICITIVEMVKEGNYNRKGLKVT